MSNKANGKIVKIYDEVQLTEKFKKREFVIQLPTSNYRGSDYLKFSLIQEQCSMVDSFKEQDNVKVSYEVKAREWVNNENETVYINDVRALSIARCDDEPTEPVDISGEGDDLPF